MALQSSTGYVRISISTGFDESTLTVNWMCFHNSNWRENNPRRVWAGIVEIGSHTFDLALKETQTIELDQPYQDKNGKLITHEIREVTVGYLPQSMETAHELLRSLSGKECNFKSVSFQVV
jgi:hypothetical protein